MADIFRILRSSPELEVLGIEGVKVADNPADQDTTQLHLPRLERLSLRHSSSHLMRPLIHYIRAPKCHHLTIHMGPGRPRDQTLVNMESDDFAETFVKSLAGLVFLKVHIHTGPAISLRGRGGNERAFAVDITFECTSWQSIVKLLSRSRVERIKDIAITLGIPITEEDIVLLGGLRYIQSFNYSAAEGRSSQLLSSLSQTSVDDRTNEQSWPWLRHLVLSDSKVEWEALVRMVKSRRARERHSNTPNCVEDAAPISALQSMAVYSLRITPPSHVPQSLVDLIGPEWEDDGRYEWRTPRTSS